MIVDKGGHYEGWRLVEVYDDAQRARGIEIATEEALAPRRWIGFSNVRLRDGVEYCRLVLEHLRSALREMTFGALVEHHSASVGIGCLTGIAWHRNNATRCLG